jgi:hypothetical protein
MEPLAFREFSASWRPTFERVRAPEIVGLEPRYERRTDGPDLVVERRLDAISHRVKSPSTGTYAWIVEALEGHAS